MRLLLLPIILLCLLSNAQAQLIRPRPTATNVECPSYLVQIKVDGTMWRNQSTTDWGTGSLIDPEHVLTCKHNVELRHKKVTVIFSNGDEVNATVLARHPTVDLLLLKLDKVRYEKPLKLHPDIQRVQGGQNVKTIGFPGGGRDERPDEYEGKAQVAVFNLPGIERALFRHDGMATQGVSGGPVLVDGKLVGVMFGTYEGLGIYCVNTHVIREFIERIK